jgi:hypothetical protein
MPQIINFVTNNGRNAHVVGIADTPYSHGYACGGGAIKSTTLMCLCVDDATGKFFSISPCGEIWGYGASSPDYRTSFGEWLIRAIPSKRRKGVKKIRGKKVLRKLRQLSQTTLTHIMGESGEWGDAFVPHSYERVSNPLYKLLPQVEFLKTLEEYEGV